MVVLVRDLGKGAIYTRVRGSLSRHECVNGDGLLHSGAMRQGKMVREKEDAQSVLRNRPGQPTAPLPRHGNFKLAF